MSVGLQRNIGSLIAAAFGMPSTAVASDTTQDNDPIPGSSIDRLSLGRRYLSAKIVAPVRIALTNAEKATITVSVQDSPDNTNWSDYSTDAPATAVVVGSSATSVSDTGGDKCAVMDVDLTRARRYIRPRLNVAFTATSSAGNSVTGMLAWVFGGAEVVPAT